MLILKTKLFIKKFRNLLNSRIRIRKKTFRIHNTTYAADWFGLGKNSGITQLKKITQFHFKMRRSQPNELKESVGTMVFNVLNKTKKIADRKLVAKTNQLMCSR